MESAENQQASANPAAEQIEGETYRLQQPVSKPKVLTKKKVQQSSWLSILFGELPMESETTMFILVSVLDIVMTWYLISHSNRQVVEANPVAAFFLYRWGGNGLVGFKMFMVAVVCVLTQIIERFKPPLGLRVLQLGTTVVAFVVVYSFILALRMAP
jgi:hypothetical protein